MVTQCYNVHITYYYHDLILKT